MMASLFSVKNDVPITRLIEQRRSVRTYSAQPASPEIRREIEAAIKDLDGPFGAKVRFGLIDKTSIKAGQKVRLGTYGVVLGAKSFIAVAVEEGDGAMETVGYVFEKAVLRLTALGLGTCWMAGTFKRSAFAQALDLHDNEVLPVISPVGYASNLRGPVDLIFKPTLTRRRHPWHSLFFDGDWGKPLDQTEAGAFAVPLEMVRLAPSASNKQPWRALRKDGSFHFFLERSPLYRRFYDFDMQKIDMGIAALHFEAASVEAGLRGHWELPSGSVTGPAGKTADHVMTWISE
jgi:hypothetical protein